MKQATLFLVLFLLLPMAAQAQDFVTTTQVALLLDKGTSLTSDRKDKLALIDHGRAVSGTAFLPKDTLVKVVTQQNFEVRGTVSVSGNSTPKENYQAAYVQVQSGDQKGKAGWVLMSSPNSGSTLAAAPKDFQATQAANANATAASDAANANVPDLQPAMYGNTGANVAGKQVYGASVNNSGGVEAKGAFDVVVKVGDKVVKTEKVRNLRPGGAHSFTFEVSDTHARNHVPVTITVDPGNSIKEGNEGNNVASGKL